MRERERERERERDGCRFFSMRHDKRISIVYARTHSPALKIFLLKFHLITSSISLSFSSTNLFPFSIKRAYSQGKYKLRLWKRLGLNCPTNLKAILVPSLCGAVQRRRHSRQSSSSPNCTSSVKRYLLKRFKSLQFKTGFFEAPRTKKCQIIRIRRKT